MRYKFSEYSVVTPDEPGLAGDMITTYPADEVDEAIKELVDALKKYGKREHYEGFDYICSGPNGGPCCCGADEHNAAVQKIIDKYGKN